MAATHSSYPSRRAERDRWIVSHRGPKNALDPWKPYAFLWEEEPGPLGDLVPTATIFLTNRECPFRCLMCDLWLNTLDAPTPLGAVPAQIAYALERLPPARHIKLYNAGNFFDPHAIPEADYAGIASLVKGFDRVVVECHPALLGQRCIRFQQIVSGHLEVAVGLETAHPVVLDKLNKRLTVDGFRRAADFLRRHGIDLRVFLLVRPPFMSEQEGVEWALRSLDVAFDCGASVCSLIPTRAGNGAMEILQAGGEYAPPSLRSLEAVQEYGLSLRCGRVFSDLWDVERFFLCACSPARAARLRQMNRAQRVLPPIECSGCGNDAR